VSSYATESKEPVTLVSALSPPYVYYTENGELQGIIVDMVKMMNEVSDYEVILYHVPPPRIYLELADGYADLSILPPGENADAVADRIVEVSRASVVLAALNENKDKLSTLADLSRKRVGYVKGINYGALFDNIPNVYEVPLLSTDVGIEMLLKNRIDFILSSERTLAYHLQVQRFSNNVAMAYELSKVPAYLYTSKKSKHNAELKSHFSEIISQLIASNKWQEIYQHLALPK
jgi:ABC-type amino acid transport substrate-binding protein